MRVFAIRHRPSGLFLPGGRSRGFTHDEPSTGIPRLFHKQSAAKCALSCWLKGEWSEETSGGSGPWGDDFDVYPAPPREPPAHRKAEEMEIVELELKEPTHA